MMETLWPEMAALPPARSIDQPTDHICSVSLLRCLGRAMQITCILSALYTHKQQMVCCSRIGPEAMPDCRSHRYIYMCISVHSG